MVFLLEIDQIVMTYNLEVKLAIIIPIYNRFTDIYNLLQCLNLQTFQEFKVVIVDHGTQDFLFEPNTYIFTISLIKASPGLWFTGATNTGIQYVLNHEKEVNFIMIMNDDIQVKDEKFLQTFVKASRDKAIISCMAINSANQKIIYAGLKLKKLQCFYHTNYKGWKPEEIHEDKIQCDVLPTRSTLVPISVIKKIGLLNEEKLPQYGSDYEWTSRAKKNNIELIMLTSTYIRTQISSNRVNGKNQYSKNKLKFFLKDLFDRHKSGNIYDLVHYSFLVFNWHYAFFFIFVGLLRKIFGFAIINYFKDKHRSSVL
uniref:Glycosyltransferase family 2 protein n=1 Tax=Planktothricoides sp. SpSt-374 TaxID=2282167 RepID=A0A7C3ZKX0_9CYAN